MSCRDSNRVTPVKVCAVPYRLNKGALEVLAFQHPLAGKQFVKGTLEPGEEPSDGARRELEEESGLAAESTGFSLGEEVIGDPPAKWLFFAFALFAPDCWSHSAPDDGGHSFAFFWHPLDTDLDAEWHPSFHRAFALIRARLPLIARGEA